MPESKRRDNKGNALRKGECYRKDGRYSYGFTPSSGGRKVIYAPTLLILRKKEQQLRHDLEDGIDIITAEKITLNEVVDRYFKYKYNLKETTARNYRYMYDRFARDTIGRKRISTIRYSDIRKYLFDLITERGLAATSVDHLYSVIHPALQMAVRDRFIRNNPSEGVMREVKQSNLWKKPRRRSLSKEDEKRLLEFVKSSETHYGWYPVIVTLLGTGLRIGECAGLTWDDVDFDAGKITVRRSISYMASLRTERSEYHVQTPKTEAGEREIPMLQEVRDALVEQYMLMHEIGIEGNTIDGVSGFVFLTTNGNPYTQNIVNSALRRIIKDFNSREEAEAKKEHREPNPLPAISCHIFRHTFCTRLCENDANIKVIQTVMGHADVSTTLDIYTDCSLEKKKEVLHSLEGKIIL